MYTQLLKNNFYPLLTFSMLIFLNIPIINNDFFYFRYDKKRYLYLNQGLSSVTFLDLYDPNVVLKVYKKPLDQSRDKYFSFFMKTQRSLNRITVINLIIYLINRRYRYSAIKMFNHDNKLFAKTIKIKSLYYIQKRLTIKDKNDYTKSEILNLKRKINEFNKKYNLDISDIGSHNWGFDEENNCILLHDFTFK